MNQKSFVDDVICSTGEVPESVILAENYSRLVSIDVPAGHKVIVYAIKEPKQTAKEFVEAVCKEHSLVLDIHKNPINLHTLTIYELYTQQTTYKELRPVESVAQHLSDAYLYLAATISKKEAVINRRTGVPTFEIIQIPEFKE